MIRALYTASTGMNAQELNVSTISNTVIPLISAIILYMEFLPNFLNKQ